MNSKARSRLHDILTLNEPSDELFGAVSDGYFEQWIPEIPAMSMEQDPIHQHKDVLTHTIAVTTSTPPVFRLRLAALLHDVGKPATRRYTSDGATFHHHEAVGARISRRRLGAMGFDADFVAETSRLVELSGRFKGYANGWSDSAVRRYARDAGPLLGDLNVLVRCDCTTRNIAKVANLHRQIDDLECRIRELAKAEELARRRPPLSGDEVMALLGLPPGPLVGQAMQLIRNPRHDGGTLGMQEAIDLLTDWFGRIQS